MYHVLIVEDSADEARILEGHLLHYAHEHELEFDVERLSSLGEKHEQTWSSWTSASLA